MKRLVLASCVAVFGFPFAASAADMAYPVKAPMIVVPAFSWTGFYLGGNIGYGWTDFDQRFPGCDCEPSTDFRVQAIDEGDLLLSPSGDGFIGGGQIGYNYQFYNNWVIGVEADFQWTDIDGSTNQLGEFGEFSYKSELEWYGTIRARLGYAWDHLLVYATGGAAYGKTRLTEQYVDDFDSMYDYKYSQSETKWGWAVGAGFEYAFTDNWTFKVEYMYVDLGEATDSNFYDGDFDIDPSVDVKIQTVKLGVNYKF
jgi:outer membrane immunogenic protein